jgi:hypothetical protein
MRTLKQFGTTSCNFPSKQNRTEAFFGRIPNARKKRIVFQPARWASVDGILWLMSAYPDKVLIGKRRIAWLVPAGMSTGSKGIPAET